MEFLKSIKRAFCSEKFLEVWSLFYIVILILRVFLNIFAKSLSSNLEITDFFINYQGGFVRRGLLGQGLLCLFENNIDPITVVLSLSLISFIIIAFYFVINFRKRQYPLFLLLICFLLGNIGTYGLTFMRRDYMILAIFLGILYLYRRLKFSLWVVICNILVSMVILCYEPFFFFAIPLLLLISRVKVRSWTLTTLYFLPSFGVFVFCCLYKGDSNAYLSVIDSTKNIIEAPGLLSFLASDTLDVIRTHFFINFCEVKFGIPSILVSLISILSMIYYCLFAIPSFQKDQDAIRFRSDLMLVLLGICIVCQLPMFMFLSTDYGRICTYCTISSFAILFSVPEKDIENALPTLCLKNAQIIIAYIYNKVNPTKFKITCILLFGGIAAWSGHIGRMIVTSEVGCSLRTVIELMGVSLQP